MFLLFVFMSFHFTCTSFHFDDPRSSMFSPMSVKRILNAEGTAFTWMLSTREQFYLIPPVPTSTSACSQLGLLFQIYEKKNMFQTTNQMEDLRGGTPYFRKPQFYSENWPKKNVYIELCTSRKKVSMFLAGFSCSYESKTKHEVPIAA